MPCDRVLLVETDEDLSGAIAEVVRDEGLRLCVATRFEEALGVLDRGCVPAVIVVDVPQPAERAAPLLERLRRDARLQPIPLLALTAVPAALPRAAVVMPKPFRPEELCDVLRACLRGRAGERPDCAERSPATR